VEVGVSRIIGSTRTTAVGVSTSEAQAPRMKILAIKNNIKKVRFMGILENHWGRFISV
jgi:hypothetical protein